MTPEEALPGTWSLSSVNGSALPFTIFEGGSQRVEITVGELEIDTDHTFELSLTIRTTDMGVSDTETDRDSGSWTITGNQVTFTYSASGITDPGVLNGDELAVLSQGRVLGFRRDD